MTIQQLLDCYQMLLECNKDALLHKVQWTAKRHAVLISRKLAEQPVISFQFSVLFIKLEKV